MFEVPLIGMLLACCLGFEGARLQPRRKGHLNQRGSTR